MPLEPREINHQSGDVVSVVTLFFAPELRCSVDEIITGLKSIIHLVHMIPSTLKYNHDCVLNTSVAFEYLDTIATAWSLSMNSQMPSVARIMNSSFACERIQQQCEGLYMKIRVVQAKITLRSRCSTTGVAITPCIASM